MATDYMLQHKLELAKIDREFSNDALQELADEFPGYYLEAGKSVSELDDESRCSLKWMASRNNALMHISLERAKRANLVEEEKSAAFELDNVSYYPSDGVKAMHIGPVVLDLMPWQNLEESVKFMKLSKQGGRDVSNGHFGHYDAKGTFTIHLDRDNSYSHLGTIELERMVNRFPKDDSTDGLPFVHELAFSTQAHKVQEVGNVLGSNQGKNKGPTFYTEDWTGSKWSIHCKPFKYD